MSDRFGPWASSIQVGSNPQLSAFWKKRMTMLETVSKTNATISRRNLLLLGTTGTALGILPTLRLASALGDEKPSETIKGETKQDPQPNRTEKALVLRFIDEEGKPVEGAHLGDTAFFDCKEPQTPSDDGEGWRYVPHSVSDRDGIAKITDEETLQFGSGVYARHAARKLVAVQCISSEQHKDTVTVVMHPECKLSGTLISTGLEACNKKITWSNVYVFMDKYRFASCRSLQADYHFYLPPGTYKLEAYGTEVHGLEKTVTIEPGQKEKKIDPIDLPPKEIELLVGKPAPELVDVVAWKNSDPLKLSDLRGKVVILDFWGYWCNPCVGEIPHYFSLYERLHKEGLVVIGIHQDVRHDDASENVDTVAKLDQRLIDIKRKKWMGCDIPFPVALVLDHPTPFRTTTYKKAHSPLFAAYGIDGVPSAVLIDRQGCVVGPFDRSEDLPLLEKALADKP